MHYLITINFEENIEIEEIERKQKELSNLINNKIQLWTYIYICVEFNEKNNIHFHCLLGVRSLIGWNDSLSNYIKNILRDFYETDTYVQPLKKEIDAKNAKVYINKDLLKNHQYNALHYVLCWQQIFAELLDYSESVNMDLKSWGYEQSEEFDKLQGYKNNELIQTQEIIGHLWMYYTILNGWYLNKNKFYKKVDNFRISYEEVGDTDFLIKEFSTKIIPFFLKKFIAHFFNLDVYGLCTKFFNNNILKNLMETFKNNANKVEFDFTLLEFTDGVYSIKIDKFIPKHHFTDSVVKGLATLKHYKKTYKHLPKTPTTWITNLKKVLNNETEKIDSITMFVANIFHNNPNIFKKKRVLFVIGEANTQKTTLIANPLINFFTREKIGVMTKGSNFNFEDFENKSIILIDEFLMQNKYIGELLKWFEGDDITIDVKYEKPKIIKNKPTILISNKDIKLNTRDKEIEEAFNARLFKLIFKSKLNTNEINLQIKELLKGEEASIIIYCNKKFFEKNISKKTRLNYKRALQILLNSETVLWEKGVKQLKE
jgi:hypothetical protein